MRILVLGGTVFLGRALTETALAAGHAVTHFNRGRSGEPYEGVTTIVGDRATVDERTFAGEWDAVVDTSGYHPAAVRRSVAALADRSPRYVFVSSISAYASFDAQSVDEDSPLAPPPDPLPESMTMETYGALKAMCEGVVRERYGENALVIRPGLIVGPHDRSDRFTYWPVRIARGGRVLAPGRPGRRTQFIDVRDLGDWIVRLVENGASGIFNATGPREPVAMQAVLDECRAVSGSDARFEWLADDFLVAEGVGAWMELPLWIPESDSSSRGLMNTSIDRALAAGLTFRPLAQTISGTLQWAGTRASSHEWKAGLGADREAALLARWDETRK